MNIKKILRERIEDSNNAVRRPFKMDIPKDVVELWKAFNSEGHDLYVVGGSIRDALLNTTPKDWDLATDAGPDKIISILRTLYFVTSITETGKAFGVINALTADDEYEIATYSAQDPNSAGRQQGSIGNSNIQQDADRRDLRINALYYDIKSREIIDMVGGLKDMDDIINGNDSTINSNGDATTRFNEDRIRILRAIRFASRFDVPLSDDIINSIKNDNDMSKIAGERIREEFIKGIGKAKSVRKYLEHLFDFGLFKFIFPNLEVDTTQFKDINSYIPLIALLLNKSDNTISKKLNKAKYNSDEINGVIFLLNLMWFKPKDVQLVKTKMANVKLSSDDIMLFVNNMGLDTNLIQALINFELTVNGGDLIKQGFKPGPDMGVAIRQKETENFLKML